MLSCRRPGLWSSRMIITIFDLPKFPLNDKITTIYFTINIKSMVELLSKLVSKSLDKLYTLYFKKTNIVKEEKSLIYPFRYKKNIQTFHSNPGQLADKTKFALCVKNIVEGRSVILVLLSCTQVDNISML